MIKERHNNVPLKTSQSSKGFKMTNHKIPCYVCQRPWRKGNQCQKIEELHRKKLKNLCLKCIGSWSHDHKCKRGKLNKRKEKWNYENLRKGKNPN